MGELKIKHEILLPNSLAEKAFELSRGLLDKGCYIRGSHNGIRITWTEIEDRDDFIERMKNE